MIFFFFGAESRIRTHGRFPASGFQNRCFRPLSHLRILLVPYLLVNLVCLIGASVRWKHLYLRSCTEVPPTTGYVTFIVP